MIAAAEGVEESSRHLTSRGGPDTRAEAIATRVADTS